MWKNKKIHVLWIFLFFPLLLNAQSIISVRYSPESTNFLGHLKYYSKLDFEYSRVMFQNRRFIYHPSIRLSILNFHLGKHDGYTDKYGVAPGKHFGAIGLVPGAFSERLFKIPVYADEGIGVAFFPRRFPNTNGRNFNVILEAGFHVALMNTLIIGYRYSHVSNAWTGRINPGIDSNMLSIGVIIR